MSKIIASFSLAGALGVTLALMTSPAFALLECDRNGDAQVDKEEARTCLEADFDDLAEGQEMLSEDRFQEGEMPQFSEVDANGDGQVSRDEWAQFGEQRFGEATQASEGRMSAEQYGTWRMQGMRP